MQFYSLPFSRFCRVPLLMGATLGLLLLPVKAQNSANESGDDGPAKDPTYIRPPQQGPDLSIRLLSEEIPNSSPNGPLFEPWKGERVFGLNNDETKPEQKIVNVSIIGVTRSYLIKLTNNSAATGEFKLDLSTAPEGWTALLFRDLAPAPYFAGGSLINFDPKTGGPTFSLPADGTMNLRMDLITGSTATSDYEVKVRATSSTKEVDQVSVFSQLQMISEIRWSRDGQTWNDFTIPINPRPFEVIGFQAVPLQKKADYAENPELAFIEVPGPRPEWTVRGVKHWGERIWIQFSTVGSTVISAQCGNQKSVTVDFTAAP